MTRASRSRELRRALPLGTDLRRRRAGPDDVEAVRAALLEALQQVDASDLVAGLAGAARAAQRPAPLAPLAQAEAATAPRRVVAGGAAGPRRGDVGAGCRWPHAAAQQGRRASPVERTDLAAVEQLLATGSATAGELGLELARVLLRSGVVVPA